MKTILWMPRAEKDLAAIHAYISSDSPIRAHVAVRRIIKAAERLASFPGSGRKVPEYKDPAIRETLVYNYRVIYLVLEDEIHILTIHHGAKPLGADTDSLT